VINRLATGEYIYKGQSLLITGATACGKSFLASALGHQAYAEGKKVAYYSTQKLFVKTNDQKKYKVGVSLSGTITPK